MAQPPRRKLRNQMNYIRGQANGVARMVEADAAAADVVIQLRAMRAGIDRALRLALEGSAREQLAAELRARVLVCPGLCDYCDDLDAIIAELDLSEVIGKVAAA
jgi:DNA-binding FrmR family transcriptional regulator